VGARGTPDGRGGSSDFLPGAWPSRGSVKAVKRGGFVRLDVENREEPGDLQDVVHSPAEIHQLQLAARAADGRVGPDELADAGAVDIVDIVQVEEDFAMSLLDQVANHVPQGCAGLAERDPAAEIDHGDIANLAACSLQGHGNLG